MIEFIKTLLSLSVSGTILILFLSLMKSFIKNQTSKKWQYYIWIVVIARLLIPFAPEMSLVNQGFHSIAPTELGVIQPQTLFSQREKAFIKSNEVIENEVIENEEITTDLLLEEVSAPATISISFLIQVCLITVWILVALVLFIHKVITYRKFTRYIKTESAEVSELEYLELLGNAVEHMNIKHSIGLYTNNAVASPLLVGFFKASIVLPTLDLADTDLYYTFIHELIHYKRRDMFYKWLVQVTICLHWFNPFVYLMGREINHACELSCDEAVITNLNYANKRTYGDILLKAAKIRGRYNNSLASVTLVDNKGILKERLDSIMNYKKKTKSILCVMIVLTFILFGVATGLGAYSFGETVKAATKDDTTKNNSTSGNNLDKIKNDIDKINAATKGANFGIDFDGKGVISAERGYYKDAYVFLIKWDNKSKKADQYPTKAEIKLSNQSVKTVYFSDSCKKSAKEEALLSALGKLLDRILPLPEEAWMLDANPIVEKTLHVGTDLEQVAEKYYSEKNIWVFASILPEIDYKLQLQYAKKAYEDKRKEFLDILAEKLSKEDLNTFTKKAYEDNKIDIFEILSEYLSKEDAMTFAKQAYKDNKQDLFEELSYCLSKEDMGTLAKQAYKDNKLDFFEDVSDGLSKEDMGTLAKQAYKDDKLDFFEELSEYLSKEDMRTLAKQTYMDDKLALFEELSEYLSKEDMRTLAKQAYKDDKLAFFEELSEYLSKEDIKTLAKQAYKDNKIAFYEILSE